MLDLPDSNKEAVYQRMISERQNIAAGYTADGQYQSNVIKNTTDKDVSIIISEAEAKAEKIRAEGEAEYMRILSNAYNDESKADYYNYIRSLDALKASLKGSNKTVILNENSELARILQGTDGQFWKNLLYFKGTERSGIREKECTLCQKSLIIFKVHCI